MPQNCTEKTMLNKEFVVDDSFLVWKMQFLLNMDIDGIV